MSTENVPLLPKTHMTASMHFGISKDFHTRSEQQDADSNFLGNERRPCLQDKPKDNTRMQHEAMTALLCSSSQGQSNTEKVQKLIGKQVGYRDLSSLTDEDLKYFGFASSEERSELLKIFKLLPNQDPSYKHICNGGNGDVFNNQIIANASNHLMYLRSAMAATNYKLHVMPPDDVLVGDKRYASRFALEALNSVQALTAELEKDINKLIQLNPDYNSKNSSKPAKENNLKFLYFAAIALGSACAWFWWWSKRSISPTFENISVKI